MNFEKFLVDTTIWVLYFRGEKDLENKIKSLILEEKIVTTEIIIMEILRGAKSQREYNQLYDDFTALPVLKLNNIIWEKSYKIGFKLRKMRINVPLSDILITMVAEHYNCLLLHRDKHFSLIERVVALKQQKL